jgi:transcriptional regulator with XRE-family HTH domain
VNGKMGEKLQISLTAARVNAGFSLDEVAKKMQRTKGTIINWEKGRTPMKISDFDELCNLYKISKEYIVLPTTLQKVE